MVHGHRVDCRGGALEEHGGQLVDQANALLSECWKKYGSMRIVERPHIDMKLLLSPLHYLCV